MVGDTRQGWAILAAMTLVFVVAARCLRVGGEPGQSAADAALGVDQATTATQPGGNMEGKEARFGIANSALWATATTAASNGSVNSMHDSFTPLGGLVPMWLIQLGEVIFGGVGSGLYGMLMFVVVAVFVAGLMIGRTPEYLGKKIEAYEMKMASIAVLVPLFTCLFGTAIAVMVDVGKSSVANPAAHGFSEILYAFTSASGNNGSAFAGLSANTPFYNTALGIVMFFARFWIIIPVLALAGSIVAKKRVPAGAGTLPTHTSVVRAVAGRRRDRHRRVDVLPRARARPDRRAPAAVSRSKHHEYPAQAVSADILRLSVSPPRSLVTASIFKQALIDAVVKLLPQNQWKNPVMFVVYHRQHSDDAAVVSGVGGHGEAPAGFILAITLWLWFTVLFANFAEAIAEGRSKAQADTLRAAKRDTIAKKLAATEALGCGDARQCGRAAQRRCVIWSRRATSFRPTAK